MQTQRKRRFEKDRKYLDNRRDREIAAVWASVCVWGENLTRGLLFRVPSLPSFARSFVRSLVGWLGCKKMQNDFAVSTPWQLGNIFARFTLQTNTFEVWTQFAVFTSEDNYFITFNSPQKNLCVETSNAKISAFGQLGGFKAFIIAEGWLGWFF